MRPRASLLSWTLCGTLSCACALGSPTPKRNPDAKRVDEVCLDCAAGEKCVPGERPDSPFSISYACLPAGTVEPGGDCEIQASGLDDCVADAMCTTTGVADSDPNAETVHRVCRQYCATDEDCPRMAEGMSLCRRFEAAASNLPTPVLPGGICVETCTPFGTDCGPTGTCAALGNHVDGGNAFLTCHFSGPASDGQDCEGHHDCGAELACVTRTMGLFRTTKCEQLCDADHLCGLGQCEPIVGSVGLCVPFNFPL